MRALEQAERAAAALFRSDDLESLRRGGGTRTTQNARQSWARRIAALALTQQEPEGQFLEGRIRELK
jgi:hypothetical protein